MQKQLLFILILLLFKPAFPQNFMTEKTPQRIILNLTSSPESSMAVTWRTVVNPEESVVQFAEPTNWIEFEETAKTIKAVSTEIVTDKKYKVVQHSAKMEDLKPNTLYIYRVGGDSIWSEWQQFTTAKIKNEPFQFVFFGDPQNDLKMHCSRVFRQAFKTAPDASFWLFSGDICSEPEDVQYQGFFEAGGFIFGTVPSILTPGNHDFGYEMKDGEIVKDERGKKVRSEIVSYMFREHFTLPENGPAGFEESTYYVDYQGVRFVMVNTALEDKLEDLADWIDKTLSDNPNKWTVVSFHHPFYSAGRDRDDDETREAFGNVFDKHHVDLVLTGHDHAYSRSYKLVNSEKVAWNKKGTVYVLSVSGPKMYPVNSTYTNLMEKMGGNTQLFQVISVSDKKLEYQALTTTGEVFDSFVLKK